MKLRPRLDTLLQLSLTYGGGVVALAALAVSMVSLYWTVHTVDDFRVIPFSNKFDWSQEGGSLSSTIVGMFINNGTRSAAVTKISMGITHFTAPDYDTNAAWFFGEPTEKDCMVSPNDANIFRYDIAPFVVGKEEIVSQNDIVAPNKRVSTSYFTITRKWKRVASLLEIWNCIAR